MSICGTIDPTLSKKESSTTGTNVASAVGMKKEEDLWPNGSTIRIYFDMTPEEASDFTWGQDTWLVAKAKELYRGDYIWKGQKDPIQIEAYGSSLSFPQIFHRVIKERIAPLVHLRFQFVDNIEESDVRVGWADDDADYYGVSAFPAEHKALNAVGLRGKTVRFLRTAVDVAVILHELGHTLGMHHEFTNPNRDATGKPQPLFLQENVEMMTGLPSIYTSKQLTDVEMYNATAYDPYSIMHYTIPGYLWGYNRKTKTTGFVQLTVDGRSIMANSQLSEMDKKWLQETYPGGGFEVNDIPLKFKNWYGVTWIIKYLLAVIVYLFIARLFQESMASGEYDRLWLMPLLFYLVTVYLDRNGRVLTWTIVGYLLYKAFYLQQVQGWKRNVQERYFAF